MSLTYAQIVALCHEMAPLLEGKSLTFFHAIALRTFILNFGKQRLLICLQEPFLRVHLSTMKTKSIDPPFAQKMHKSLVGGVLKKMEILNQDRILKLTFEKGDKIVSLLVELFPKRTNLYLLDSNMRILNSLSPVRTSLYQLPPKPCTTAEKVAIPHISSFEIEKIYHEEEEKSRFEREKQNICIALSRRLKQAEKLRAKYMRNLEIYSAWRDVQHEGKLLQANMFRMKKGMTQIAVADWEQEGKEKVIALDPKLMPKDEVEKRFRQSRKFRKGIEHTKTLLVGAQTRVEEIAEHLKKLDTANSLAVLEEFRIPKKQPRKTKSLPFREYQTAAGLKLWVGKSAKDNDALTFHHAKGSDWWFHVRDFSGSHVVLRVNKGQEPDQDSIQDALQMALFHSKARDEGEADVCVTQCKYISRFGKGKAGKVHVSKHKVMHVRLVNSTP